MSQKDIEMELKELRDKLNRWSNEYYVLDTCMTNIINVY